MNDSPLDPTPEDDPTMVTMDVRAYRLLIDSFNDMSDNYEYMKRAFFRVLIIMVALMLTYSGLIAYEVWAKP